MQLKLHGQEIRLETRICPQCQKPFRVTPRTKQLFCSKLCKWVFNPRKNYEVMRGWRDPKLVLNDDEI